MMTGDIRLPVAALRSGSRIGRSRSAEVEDGARQIDIGMIVHQPRRHQAQQRFRDGQFADRGRAVEEDQFHGPQYYRHPAQA